MTQPLTLMSLASTTKPAGTFLPSILHQEKKHAKRARFYFRLPSHDKRPNHNVQALPVKKQGLLLTLGYDLLRGTRLIFWVKNRAERDPHLVPAESCR